MSPKLVGEYYPNAAKIIKQLNEMRYKIEQIPSHNFDELHLPPEIDYTRYDAKDIYYDEIIS